MFTMTVAGAETFTVPTGCIESAKFISEIPKGSDARSKDVSTTLVLQGSIIQTDADRDPYDYTCQIAKWSAIASGNADCYRDVTLTYVRFGAVLRKYDFTNAFVVDYSESFDDETNSFTLVLKQKKDHFEHVVVNGGFLS